MADELPSMKGKTVLITGATRGIGRAGAEAMARLGANLILVGRDEGRLQEAQMGCQAQGAGAVRVYRADLSLRKAVADLAHRIDAYEPTLDVLWNNAGGYFATRNTTQEGYEKTWAMNHLAYFDLTQLLFPLLEKSGDPRILCTDPRYRGTPAAKTDVRRTFKRARAELASGAAADWPVRYVLETREPVIEQLA